MDIVTYLDNINKDNALNFISNTNSSLVINRDKDIKKSDTSWIDMLEECIPYLDNIIRNPRRFIVQEENIVPIEKVKVVTEESIKHLAQNTNLIQEVEDDGTVIPLKLLNVYREETVDLYENRFIKSLVDNLYVFVDNKMKESDQKSFSKIKDTITYNGTMKTKDKTIDIKLSMNSFTSKTDDKIVDGHSLDERIEHLRDVLASFRGSTFIKSLKESSPVRSPIRKTNVILKEPNFIKALELWEYLEKNNIKPMTETVKESESVDTTQIKDKYDLAFFIDDDALVEDRVIEAKDGSISKVIDDYVMNNDVSNAEFKRLVNKEYTSAVKRKGKLINEITKIVDAFVVDAQKHKKKSLDILK